MTLYNSGKQSENVFVCKQFSLAWGPRLLQNKHTHLYTHQTLGYHSIFYIYQPHVGLARLITHFYYFLDTLPWKRCCIKWFLLSIVSSFIQSYQSIISGALLSKSCLDVHLVTHNFIKFTLLSTSVVFFLAVRNERAQNQSDSC